MNYCETIEIIDTTNSGCLNLLAKNELTRLRKLPQFQRELKIDDEFVYIQTTDKGHLLLELHILKISDVVHQIKGLTMFLISMNSWHGGILFYEARVSGASASRNWKR